MSSAGKLAGSGVPLSFIRQEMRPTPPRAMGVRWGVGQMMTLPPHAGAALHGDIIYSDEITFAMLSTTAGAPRRPRGGATLRAFLPSGHTPVGRRTAEFRESLEEVGDAVEIARPGFQGIAAAARKAKALCAHTPYA